MAAVAIRPYRDFVNPEWHRRLARSNAWSFVACYFIAIWMGEGQSWFWRLNPIGPTGARSLILFVSSLMIYVIRVRQMHFGRRTTESPKDTILKYTFRLENIFILIWYAGSAWIFSEAYIWSSRDGSFAFTDPGKLHERIRLNERPLVLRFLFFTLAVAQTGVHIWKDYDRVELPVKKPVQEEQHKTKLTGPGPWAKLASSALIQVTTVLIIGYVVYFFPFFPFRRFLWGWHYSLAKILVSLSKNSKPPGFNGHIELGRKFLVEGSILVGLWDFSQKKYDEEIVKEPLKKEKPLTNDSKDPNGSLLYGLKSKKDIQKFFALWELSIITDRFEDRRKSIYSELDRKKGRTAQQVVEICLAEIKGINQRINAVLSMPSQPSPEQEKETMKKLDSVALVPRISGPLKDDQIAGPGVPPKNRTEELGNLAASIAKTRSSPQNAKDNWARKAYYGGMTEVAKGKQAVATEAKGYWGNFLSSWLGFYFRQTFQRTTTLVVNGTPFSRYAALSYAINIVTNLTVDSLKEDPYSQYHKDVPDILRAFSAAIKDIHNFINTFEPHWTDVEFYGKDVAERRKVPEVDAVSEQLKDGLHKILKAFGEFLGEMDLTKQEIREAKELVAGREEMRKAE